MQLIADDPIIRCIERTGYPPWIREDSEDDEDDEIVEYGEPCDHFLISEIDDDHSLSFHIE